MSTYSLLRNAVDAEGSSLLLINRYYIWYIHESYIPAQVRNTCTGVQVYTIGCKSVQLAGEVDVWWKWDEINAGRYSSSSTRCLRKGPTLYSLICQPIYVIFARYTTGNFQKSFASNPPNLFCVTALPCKILVVIPVTFLQLKTSLYYFGNIVISWQLSYQFCDFFKRIAPDDYYLQVLP